ncbi:hypothetical protein HDU87_002712 [Geranomyces variabilis]|uniref:F-box domain-containing protein n=1 Tax=Geranomyces variabilis TaxID=109894 RepID=A0AAD5TS34_9FUNG|nr:hypothetical protein HDU87_002712 [Geranomyces variabilis]
MTSLATLPGPAFLDILRYLDVAILPRLAACSKALRHRLDEEKPILPATRRLLKALDHDLRACNLVQPSGPEWEDYYRLFEGDALFHSPAEAAEAVIKGLTEAASELPSEQFAGIFHQSRDVLVPYNDGDMHLCYSRLERKSVVALTLPSGVKAVFGSFITLSNSQSKEYKDQSHNVEIVAELSGCDPCVVYHLNKPAEDGIGIYTAEAHLAQALNCPTATVRKWFHKLGQLDWSTSSESLTSDAISNVAASLGDGPSVSYEMSKMLNWAKAYERGDSKIFSTEMIAELRNVRQMVINQPEATLSAPVIWSLRFQPAVSAHQTKASGRSPKREAKDNRIIPWRSLLNFVTDRRARWDSRYFAKVYDLLCAETQDILSSEPAARNADAAGAWMQNHVLFTKHDVHVRDAQQGEMPETSISTRFRVGTGHDAPSFVFHSFSHFRQRYSNAKSHLNSLQVLSAEPGMSMMRTIRRFADYEASDKDKECKPCFWQDLRFAHQGTGYQSSDRVSQSEVEARMMDVWRRADPQGEWGGPWRFGLLVVALSMSFVVPNAWRPADQVQDTE